MDKYEKEIRVLRNKQKKEQDKISKELSPKYKKEWVGRCFKYRNSYGGDCKGWWLYAQIQEVCDVNFIHDGTPEPNFKAIRFQKCSDNRVEIDLEHFEYRFKDWTEIKPSKFNSEFKKLMTFIEKTVTPQP